MRFQLLGPLQVHDGELAVRVPPGKQRALLALLLLTPPQVVPVHRLVDAL